MKTGRSLLFPALLLVVAGVVLTFTTWNRHRTRDNIAWQSDVTQAAGVAKAQKKLLLLDFTASWCPPCQQMKAETWPDPEVEKALAGRFVAVQLDVDTPSAQSLSQRFQVQYIPTLIILDADQIELHRVTGKLTPAQLLAFLNRSNPTTSPTALTQPATSR